MIKAPHGAPTPFFWYQLPHRPCTWKSLSLFKPEKEMVSPLKLPAFHNLIANISQLMTETENLDLNCSLLSVCSREGVQYAYPTWQLLPPGSWGEELGLQEGMWGKLTCPISRSYNLGHLTFQVPGHQALILAPIILLCRAACFSCSEMFSPYSAIKTSLSYGPALLQDSLFSVRIWAMLWANDPLGA